MKIKTMLLTLSTLIGSTFASETAEEKTPEVQMTYPYVSLGLGPAPLPIPIFSAGYRLQRGHHGFDTSIEGATLYEVSAVKGSALYHYYFKPNPCSQFYVGVGPAYGALFSRHSHTKPFGAPEFVFGKEYINDTGSVRFFQVDIDFPIVEGKRTHDIPLVVFKYGIGF